ncbi:WD repeat-containing protein 38 [Sarcoramphus papa]
MLPSKPVTSPWMFGACKRHRLCSASTFFPSPFSSHPTAHAIPERTLEGHQGNVTCAGFSASGMLASGSWDRSVRIWDPRSGALLLLEGHACWVKRVCFPRSGLLLATAGYSGTVTQSIL